LITVIAVVVALIIVGVALVSVAVALTIAYIVWRSLILVLIVVPEWVWCVGIHMLLAPFTL
jgi:hypothetical protein